MTKYLTFQSFQRTSAFNIDKTMFVSILYLPDKLLFNWADFRYDYIKRHNYFAENSLLFMEVNVRIFRYFLFKFTESSHGTRHIQLVLHLCCMHCFHLWTFCYISTSYVEKNIHIGYWFLLFHLLLFMDIIH